MMTKIKQRVIVILLVIAITASAIITIGLNTTTSARADSGYVDVPQITVLTHGLSSRASHWSNANGTGSGGFVQDTDSLLYKLSVKAGGAYIYRAETSSNSGQNPIYTLYDGYTTTTSNAANSCDCITDVSKHIIIVFDSEDSGGSNDTIYSEFKHMLNDVIARVTSLNQGQKKPKINLIGHSRGGITNLQYTLDYPEYVDSLISIGTPYFGSPAAEVAGPLLFETSDGLTDINNETAYTNYYNRWKTGYESKYKNINSIAIGATTTIEYQRAVLNTYNSFEYSEALSVLLFWFSNTAAETIMYLGSVAAYEVAAAAYPEIRKFSMYEFIQLISVLLDEVTFGTWYSDVLVPVDSQQGVSGSKNYYFTKFIKEYNNDNTSLTPKLATNNVPVIHNLEPYDPDIHNYILENIIMKSGDTLNTEISNVGILGEYHESSDTRSVSGWYIKIRNTHNQEYTYAYNRKMCFLDDAKNWTGLTDIETFRLKAGETKIVEISANGFATSIAISYTSGSTRYIKYADNIFGDYEVYKMKTYSSTTSYRSYTENGMKVSIAGKNDGTWLIELTNNTGSGRTFYYNRKMCFDGDAQNWSGLSDVSTIYLSSGETTWAPLEISENGTATAIAISYNVGIERHIFYANNLNVSGTMTSYSNSKPTTYTQHGMKVCIVSKSGSTWKIQLTNNTGSTRTFEYNKKMCFDGDAQNWNGLADVSSITLSNGASTQLSISENGFATAITISYLIDDTRYIFWANNLNATTGTMSSYSSVLIPDIPPTECVAEGTLITLADGTQKAVEDLTGDELLLVWDMETGTYGAAPIMFVDSDLIGHYEVIELSFSDGTTVEVISEHGFWDVDLNEYVYLDENADDYIGHKFVKQNGEGYTEVTLTDVEISVEVTRAYSPVTYGHLCYYVNGMLSMPGGISGLFNIFDIDAETMSIDEEAYAADIAEYGVYTYEEFSETFPVSEEVFEAFNGKYLKVAIGKGQLTEERIGELIERYSEFF